MKLLVRLLTCIVLASSLHISTAAALGETLYVSDTLWIQLRSGPSTQNRIIQALKTGDTLTALSEETDGYIQVRTSKGTEGWVLSQFVEKKPIARIRLNQAESQLEKTQAELSAARQQASDLEASLKTIRDEYKVYKGETDTSLKEFETLKTISGNAVALDERNKKLTLQNQELEIQVEALRTENLRLREERHNTFLIYGGGLVLLGIIGGLIIPSLTNRRRSSGWA